MKYLSIAIATTSLAADIIGLMLIDEGSQGVSIKDMNDIREVLSGSGWDYVDENIITDDQTVYVSAVFDVDYDITALIAKIEELKGNAVFDVGSLKITRTILDSADYENEWKKYYTVLEIKNIAIVPAWIKYEGCLKSVYINPGKAFGTGGHETTSMCIELMQSLDLKDKNIIDLGCGSGILGLTALRLGARSCVMNDIDLQAIESAQENADINGLSDQIKPVYGEMNAENLKSYDLVLANLTADILIGYKKLFSEFLSYGNKYLIVSGIINSRIQDVLSEFNSFRLIEQQKQGEWQAVLFG